MTRQRYRPEMSEFTELIEDICYWQDRIPPNIQDRVLDEYLATGHLPEGPLLQIWQGDIIALDKV